MIKNLEADMADIEDLKEKIKGAKGGSFEGNHWTG